MELSYVLDELLGVTSKIMTVSSGSAIEGRAAELGAHFQEQVHSGCMPSAAGHSPINYLRSQTRLSHPPWLSETGTARQRQKAYVTVLVLITICWDTPSEP